MTNAVWAIIPTEENIFHENKTGYVPALFATEELAENYLNAMEDLEEGYEVVSVYVEGN